MEECNVYGVHFARSLHVSPKVCQKARKLKKNGFVNVAGSAYNDNMVNITSIVLLTEYDPPAAAGA